MVHCPTCGAAALSGHRFCAGCGSPLVPAVGSDPPPSVAPAAVVGETVVHVLATGERRHSLRDPLIIGRDQGQIRVPDDTFLSGRHATVQGYGSHYVLRDLGSRTGTYIRIREPYEMSPGDHVMVGSQVFRLEPGVPPVVGAEPAAAGDPSLVRLLDGGAEAERIPLPPSGVTVGRTRGDVLFPHDQLLSGAHASFVPAPTSTPSAPRVTVADQGSRNGVFVRIREDWRLRPGDVFSAGRQVFRFEG